MSEIRVIARMKIHEGKQEEFQSTAQQLIDLVREKDNGTLEHTWYFNDDKTECVIQERYNDSDAVLEHMGNMGDVFGKLLSICDTTIEVYGEPSDTLVEAASGLQPNYYTKLIEI